MKTTKRANKHNERLLSRRRFRRKLSRYRHTKSYSRISGGFSSVVSFSQNRNRKLLVAAAVIILVIGLFSVFTR